MNWVYTYRGRCLICGISAYLMTLNAGCAGAKQVQYFAASDPITNDVNFYRMTMTGRSSINSQYKLRAGYFNAITLDALTGSFSDPPEVSGDEEQLKAVSETRNVFRETLLADAKAAQGEGASDANLLRIARAMYLVSLDDLSMASIGKMNSLNPYVFQKLVFWAEDKPINLQQFEGQFENIFKNSMAAVKGIRNRSKQQKQQNKKRDGLIRGLMDEAVKMNPALKPLLDQFKVFLSDSDGGAEAGGTNSQ